MHRCVCVGTLLILNYYYHILTCSSKKVTKAWSAAIHNKHQITQEFRSWFWINKFSVSSGTSSDWGFCHGVRSEDCSMQQDRRPWMPEGQWLQCSSLEWTDLQIRQNGGVISRRSNWPEYSTSTGRKEPTRGCINARERIAWNEHAPRCQASGAGNGWRQTHDFCEAVGGWVWQQHASHRTVEPEDSPVLWQGARCYRSGLLLPGRLGHYGKHCLVSIYGCRLGHVPRLCRVRSKLKLTRCPLALWPGLTILCWCLITTTIVLPLCLPWTMSGCLSHRTLLATYNRPATHRRLR